MISTKSVKRMWLGSIIALCLCFAMLLGTTFAWFTDSVSSANNIIKTGVLDIAMYWVEGDEDPNADTTTWEDASKGAIFNNDKWEPGYVEAKHVKIVNEGNLALKYKLVITPNGDFSELAEKIDVYFIPTATKLTREELNTTYAGFKVGTLADMIVDPDGSARGFLLVDDQSTEDVLENVTAVTIALKLREDTGNDYMEKSIGTDFSIKLYATQYTAEEDSFDDQYDKDAEYDS